jgi:hypothetical protein
MSAPDPSEAPTVREGESVLRPRSPIKVYDRPGRLALAARPISLLLVAILAILVSTLLAYKFFV